jgi:DNA polymerase bacteriophage-type
MRYLIYDIETRSTLNLKQVGAYRYTCDPTTDVWCVSYCMVAGGARGDIATWLPGDPIPNEVTIAAADPETLIVAFNDAFERQVEQRILHPRYGWPIFPLERRRCAQAAALAKALPAALDKAAAALQLKTRKSSAGRKAMKALAMPRRPRPGEDLRKIYWHDEPKRLATLYEYNRIDVAMTLDVIDVAGFLPANEQAIWQLDAGINDRGIHLDTALLDAALAIAEQASNELVEKLAGLTDGEISTPSQTQRILQWLARRGCMLPNIQKSTVLEALKRPDLAAPVKQLLTLRLDGAHAAVDKLATLRQWTSSDQRIRHVYRYHGAMPGRFTSLGAQVQNMKKPETEDIAAAIEAVRTGSLAQLQARYKRPLAIVGDITRALVTPAPGNRLFIADLSGIESRGLAWLCNETGKLEQWRAFDHSGDPTLEPYYRFGVEDLKLNPKQARKTGKTADLAFGYQGGLGAWRGLAPPDDVSSDQEIYSRRRAWIYRHPNIAKFWPLAVRQAVNAIEHPGELFTVARIAFQYEGHFLFMRLPSGRRIAYPFARLYADEDGRSFTFRDASGGRWEWYHVLKRKGAFGGLVAENATQALCRDIFVEAMQRLEAAGYTIVAHSHDEVICEVPDDFGDYDEFIRLITTASGWAPDFPIAAKGRIAERWIEAKPIAPAADANDDIVDDANDDIRIDLPADPLEELLVEPARSADPSPEIKMPPPEFCEPPEPPKSGIGSGNGHAGAGGESFFTEDSYRSGEAPASNPTGSYVYKDARGLLYMRVMRTSAKSFPTQHWHDGRWVNGWPQTVIPYRLPELLAAPTAEPVFVCEGEKDTDNVATLGLIATTNPGGAKNWQPELAQWFKGKQLIYVLEDNDEPGRMHTTKITAALRDIVPTIVPVTFPELPEKGDVSDWLELGGNRKLLLARAEEARKRNEGRRSYIAINLATVTPEAEDWLWPGHLARGKLELLAGTPQIGKSQIQCQYIACATTGRAWPNGLPGGKPCRVIILTAEDDTARTLVPRLQAAGANLAMVEQLKTIRRNNRDELFLLGEDLDQLEQMIRDLNDVGLVTIDPITAYMGYGKHFDSHRATDVRSQLMPLKELAERTNVAFSAVTHPPKNAGAQALDHFIGSQAFIAAARVGHLCVIEMEETADGKIETGRRLYTNAKTNIAAMQPTLAYRITVVETGHDAVTGKPIVAPVIQWDGEVNISAVEAVAAARGKERRGSAREFLLDILAAGPVLTTIVVERGGVHGFSYDQLRHAKTKLGVVAFKKRGEGLDTPWMWALPQHAPPEADKELA